MREETRTILFAAGVCLVCSLLLSGTAATLKNRQDANQKFDVQRNIIKAFGMDTKGITPETVQQLFTDHIKETTAGSDELPLYTWTEDGAVTKYAIPISGRGLWSMLYGYLALEADLETIAGISFYQHGETPGLGAEIEKSWFQEQFKGKKLYLDNQPADFSVVKPSENVPKAREPFSVDGISGATLTSAGVQNLIKADATRYNEYFTTLRSQ